MSIKFKVIFGVFLALLLLLTYLQATEPQPVNWNPSYLEKDKIPLGSYVFYNSWKERTNNLQNISIPPFEFLDSEHSGTYFFLNDYVGFDDAELDKLLSWINKGNTLFVAANKLSQNLLDTLHLETTTQLQNNPGFSSQPYLNFVNPRIKKDSGYHYNHEMPLVYFSKLDTLNNTILGTATLDSINNPEKKVDFLKAKFGTGTIFLHMAPQAFSNYFMLSNHNFEYAENAVSYLKKEGPVFWDDYNKTGKSFYTSPLYILLNNRPLKWAYYFMIIGALLFIVFEGKRKQRAIPVVEPLKNQNYEYSRTIASLYVEQKKYHSLAILKIDHFFEYIRLTYRLDTSNKNEGFYKSLAENTGNTIAQAGHLQNVINSILQKKQINKKELQDLSEILDAFKNRKQ